jgi:hypothetical protein
MFFRKGGGQRGGANIFTFMDSLKCYIWLVALVVTSAITNADGEISFIECRFSLISAVRRGRHVLERFGTTRSLSCCP